MAETFGKIADFARDQGCKSFLTWLRPVVKISSGSWTWSGSAWEALERVNSGPGPDLVLLDLMQSDSDSLHSLRWLRRVRPELPVVVLCNYDESQKLEAMRLGARECLVKPLQSRPLEAAIQRSLFQATENSESEIVARRD